MMELLLHLEAGDFPGFQVHISIFAWYELLSYDEKIEVCTGFLKRVSPSCTLTYRNPRYVTFPSPAYDYSKEVVSWLLVDRVSSVVRLR